MPAPRSSRAKSALNAVDAKILKQPPAPQAPPAPEVAAPAVDPLEEIASGERDSLSALMGELVGVDDATVTVYRATRNQPQAYMFKCSPASFSLDDLRDKFGGGEFRVYITRGGEPWRNRRVIVEQKAGGMPSEIEAKPSAVDALAAVMREGFARQAEIMATLARPAPSSSSMFSGMDLPAVITAAAAAITALRPPPAPAPAPVADSGRSVDRAMDMLMKGIELAQTMGGGGGGGDDPSLMALLRDFVKSPMLAQAVSSTLRPAVAAPSFQPARPVAPMQSQPAVAAPVVPVAQEETAMVNPLIAHYLGALVGFAAEGSDPTLYADLILDRLPDETLRGLLDAKPDPVTVLAGINPKVLQHRDWFVELVETIRAALGSDSAQNGASPAEASPDAPNSIAPELPG